MAEFSITAKQISKAQVLWSQYARNSAVAGSEKRETRLEWAGLLLRHPVASFKDLTREEGERLIDELARLTGDSGNDRERAHAMGVDGRRRSRRNQFTLASQRDLDRVNSALKRLGWSQETFRKWLDSPTSPLGGTGREIRTQADANRVWWALKKMLKGAGQWRA